MTADRPQGERPPSREWLGEQLRELEVIVSNYHSDGHRTRTESDATLFAEWQRIRGTLFDGLSDITSIVATYEAALRRIAAPGCRYAAPCSEHEPDISLWCDACIAREALAQHQGRET